MLRALRPCARSGARHDPLTALVRWTLAVLVSLAVSVPGAALSGLACGMESDGTGCTRCETALAAEPPPSCHAQPQAKTSTGGCHERGTADDCCSLQQHDVGRALLIGSPSVAYSPFVADGAWGSVAKWLDPELPPRTTPVACESPPGRNGLLVAQTTVLRL